MQKTAFPNRGRMQASGNLMRTSRLAPTTAAAAILLWRFVTSYWPLISSTPVLAGRPLWQHGRL